MSVSAVGRLRAPGAGEFRPTRRATRALHPSDHVIAVSATAAGTAPRENTDEPLRAGLSRTARGGLRAAGDMRLTSVIGDSAPRRGPGDRGRSSITETMGVMEPPRAPCVLFGGGSMHVGKPLHCPLGLHVGKPLHCPLVRQGRGNVTDEILNSSVAIRHLYRPTIITVLKY